MESRPGPRAPRRLGPTSGGRCRGPEGRPCALRAAEAQALAGRAAAAGARGAAQRRRRTHSRARWTRHRSRGDRSHSRSSPRAAPPIHRRQRPRGPCCGRDRAARPAAVGPGLVWTGGGRTGVLGSEKAVHSRRQPGPQAGAEQRWGRSARALATARGMVRTGSDWTEVHGPHDPLSRRHAVHSRFQPGPQAHGGLSTVRCAATLNPSLAPLAQGAPGDALPSRVERRHPRPQHWAERSTPPPLLPTAFQGRPHSGCVSH